MSERTASREKWLLPGEKMELPEESKNVIHKNEANVSDPSQVYTPKNIHYLSQMRDVYIKQKQFD
jgi:hypothetical protein